MDLKSLIRNPGIWKIDEILPI